MARYKFKISYRLVLLLPTIFFLASLLFSTSFLLKIPPIWPDESFIADSALNILYEGRNGTDLFGGTVAGAETSGWGYPPLFFYTTAGWFKLFSFSIANQRIFSLLLGQLFLVVFFIVSAKLTQIKISKRMSFLLLASSTILLSTDEAVLKAMHIGRPEIQVLLFGFLSLYFYLKSLDKKTKMIYSLITGLFLSLAFLSHYLAIIFASAYFAHLLILEPKKFLRSKNNWYLLLSFIVPIIFWLLTISGNTGNLINNVWLRLEYKLTSPYWIWIVFSSSPFSTKITYIMYIIISWELITASWITRNKNTVLVCLLSLFSWFWTYQWQAEFSFVFTVVFAYLGLAQLTHQASNLKFLPHLRRVFYLGVLFSLIILNLWNITRLFQTYSNKNYDYFLFVDEILEKIPDNSSVYISSIPDTYFGFKEERNNILFEYPIFPTQKEKLIDVLNRADYIVFNSALESIVVGDVVSPYIQRNAEEVIPIGSNLQYQGFVIKLKPRSARTN